MEYLKFTFPCILPHTNYKVDNIAVACSDFVPGQVKAEDALRERNSEGNGGG